MQDVAQQLLRAIRGSRSQVAFARRLGYRGNPITDWERGETFPTAVEMLRACERVGIDVVEACRRFGGIELERQQGQYALGPWLAKVAGLSASDLARRMGCSRSSVSRWLSGVGQPRVPDFLRLLDVATGRVHDLVAELVEIDTVPALLARHQAAMAAKRLAFDAPWTEAILRILETRDYLELPRHDTGWIARALGIQPSEVERCLELLLRANVVVSEGPRYVQSRPLSVDTQGGKRALHTLKAHWAVVASERARVPHPGDLFAYNLVSVSEEDLGRIRVMLRATYREIRALIAASEPSERVALLNLQLLSWSPAHDGDHA